jgi:hypothetical protein
MFPLSSDHLIILLQFNVLKSSVANRQILSKAVSPHSDDCSSPILQVLPKESTVLGILPPMLRPTTLQQTVAHEEWIDLFPHPVMRDNLILASGKFDEDDLWLDTIGGLFEGLPDSHVEQHGVIAWSPPWHFSGWEITEGFLRKWGWTLKGCQDIIDTTNHWRRQRGEEPLVVEL